MIERSTYVTRTTFYLNLLNLGVDEGVISIILTVKLIEFSALVVKSISQRPTFLIYPTQYAKVKTMPEPADYIALIEVMGIMLDQEHCPSRVQRNDFSTQLFRACQVSRTSAVGTETGTRMKSHFENRTRLSAWLCIHTSQSMIKCLASLAFLTEDSRNICSWG